jgi:hypothetical protein
MPVEAPDIGACMAIPAIEGVHAWKVFHRLKRGIRTIMMQFISAAIRPTSRMLSTRTAAQLAGAGQRLARYHKTIDADVARTETPEFRRKTETELGQAMRYIQDEMARRKKGFVVLDADDTLLDNRDFYRDPQKIFYKAEDHTCDKDSFYKKWDLWVAQAKAPVLPVGQKLIQWLNANKIPYCVVTGRIEQQREATLKNLQAANLLGDSFKGLYCKPEGGRNSTTAAFKKKIVPEIEKEHKQKAIASIGDRDADMMLPEAERNFKLSTSEFYPPRDKGESSTGSVG